MRILVVASAAFAALLLPSWAAAAPRTLVVSPRPITEVAQDGGLLAWVSRARGCSQGGETWIAVIETRRRVRVRRTCAVGAFFEYGGLAFDNGRALWQETYLDIHTASEGQLITAALSDRRVVSLGDFYPPGFDQPQQSSFSDWPIVDGDRTPLVYARSWTSVLNYEQCNQESETPPTEQCRYRLGGRAWRVVGRVSRRIPSVGPAFELAAAGGRIAYVPRPTAETTGSPGRPERRILVRRLRDGALVSEAAPAGDVKALALSDTIVVALVDDGAAGNRIERYDAANGRLLGVTAVPSDVVSSSDVASSLDVAGRRIVYRVRNAVHVLDATSGADSVVWRARRPPIDLSIEGRRIVWAANGRGRGRVIALTLPRAQ